MKEDPGGKRKRGGGKKRRKIAFELNMGHGGFVYGGPRVFPAGRGDGGNGILGKKPEVFK